MGRNLVYIPKSKLVGNPIVQVVPRNIINTITFPNYKKLNAHSRAVIGEINATLWEAQQNTAVETLSTFPIVGIRRVFSETELNIPTGKEEDIGENINLHFEITRSFLKQEQGGNDTNSHWYWANTLWVCIDLDDYALTKSANLKTSLDNTNFMLTYKIAETLKSQNASSSSVNIINEWTIIKEYKKELGEHEISMVSPDIFDISSQELDVPPSCNISKYVVSEDGKRAYFQLDMISAHYKSGTYWSSGFPPPSAQPPHTCYIITNLNLKLLCDTYIPEEAIKVIEIKPDKSRKSISISSTMLTNKTVVTKGDDTSYEFANELADDIFSNYNSGRMYGELTTYYTDFYEPNTNKCVFNGVSGKMIKPNDLIVLDYEYGLSETMFLVVGVEYLVMENKLIIKFVKNKYISGFTQEYDTAPQ